MLSSLATTTFITKHRKAPPPVSPTVTFDGQFSSGVSGQVNYMLLKTSGTLFLTAPTVRTFSYAIVGGGGGSIRGRRNGGTVSSGGGGGGGGEVKHGTISIIGSTTATVNIGLGGSAGETEGEDGEHTKLIIQEPLQTLDAKGGSGSTYSFLQTDNNYLAGAPGHTSPNYGAGSHGVTNGKAAEAAQNGRAIVVGGTTFRFGAGGGGGMQASGPNSTNISAYPNNGGNDGGGSGGYLNSATQGKFEGLPGSPNSGAGGGGGAGHGGISPTDGGNGGSGAVLIFW